MKVKQGSFLEFLCRVFIYTDDVEKDNNLETVVIDPRVLKALKESQSRINEMENGFGISKGLTKNEIEVEKVKIDHEEAMNKAESNARQVEKDKEKTK